MKNNLKKPYNPQKIEKKWQNFWNKNNTFKAQDFSKKKKFYCLDMFPYPSGEGLHVGHFRGYTFSDIIAKKRLMEGYNVLHPIGWDAFGLPAENFAIKTGINPAVSTKKAIKNIKNQLFLAGFGYDWDREIATCLPDYYKWTQWMFLKLYKAGLAYKKKAPVNFCSSCKTVLAREQVINGRCERCNTQVEKKFLEQWFFKITSYADRLLDDLDLIDWPEKIKTMQKNWIGRSEGIEIIFEIDFSDSRFNLPVFTTRADTLFGCTYLVLAPEHPLVESLIKGKKNSSFPLGKSTIENKKEIEKYIEKAKSKTEIERLAEEKEKTGVEVKGIKAINPVNNKEIPVFIADYVLPEYGTGAIMAVPAHDQRDFLFANKYGLEIIETIKPINETSVFPFEEDGILTNSGVFNGMDSSKARKEIANYLIKRNLAKESVYYKIRDWLISRQRYWGAPIPIIYCQKCGELPVKEKDLPVLLPKIKDFKPTGKGKGPLAKVKSFVEVNCPKCNSLAQRETDTMDTFVCSSWYFLRYADPVNSKEFASKKKIKHWLPVDFYIGGAEHAVMHLLYSRFFTKVLKDLKLIDFDEPFLKLFNQGTVYRQGVKMSKSKGNVVTPAYIFEQFGADTMRLYEIFMGPADQATEWSDKGVVGCYRFLNKVWKLREKVKSKNNQKPNQQLHKTIKKVTEDIEHFRFNTALSALMILINQMEKEKEPALSDYQLVIKLLAPMAPHISEEIWQSLGNKQSIFLEEWPSYDEKIIKEEKVILIIQINGKVRDKIEVEAGISKTDAEKKALAREKIKKWTEKNKIKKIIFIPDKLINIVV